MANRYWVGGSGTWDTSDTTNWSASSGGAGGESAPTSADAVFFDSSSGGGTCTIAAAVVPCLTLNLSGYTGTLDFGTNKIEISGNAATVFTQTTSCSISGTPLVDLTYAGASGTRTIAATSIANAKTVSFNVLGGSDAVALSSARVRDLNFTGFAGTLLPGSKFIYGDLTFSAGMTLASGTQVLSLRNVTSSSTSTLTTNGQTINNPVRKDSSGTCVLGDSLTINPSYALEVTSGTLDANGYDVSVSEFACTGTVARSVGVGSGTWTISGSGDAWDCTNGTNLTVTGTGTIDMTSASAKTFIGGGKSWPTLNQGGAGALTITGANTFSDITNTVEPTTITFPASTTTTVDAFTVSGTSGNLITINSSSAGTQATLSDASGQNSVSFCDIQDINATGGAIWSAFTSNGNVDSGNNTGWDFNDSLFRYIYTRRKNKRILPL